MTAFSLARPSLRTGRLARWAGTTFAWWCGELAGLLPRSLIAAVTGAEGPLAVLEFGAHDAALVVPGESRATPVRIPVDLTYGDAGLDAIRPRMMRFRQRAVPIRLANDLVLLTRVDLPLAAERSLAAILQHQLERLVPLDPATVRFAWKILERVPARNVIRVDVAIVRQATLERARALAGQLGLMTDTIEAGSGHLTFWRSPAAARSTPRERRLRRGLEAGAALLAVTSYAVYVGRLDDARTLLQEQVAAATRQAEAVQALDARARSAEHSVAFLADKKAEPTALAILDELTRTVPTDSWVSEWRLHAGVADLVGTAPRATDLIARVAGSPMFADATFRSPITLAASGSGERFDIGFRVRPGSAVPQVPTAQVSQAP